MFRTTAFALLTAFGLSAHVHAQGTYPTKPIRWVIPYAAGGGTDVVARPIAQRLGEVLGHSIVYENRGGAGGLIAGELVARAAPDGYTMLVAAGNTHVFATLLYDKIPYDPVKDYAPVTNFVEVPNILVARPAFPAKTIQELITFGKANPGKINWASSGNGAGPATAAVLGNEADLLFANAGVFISHIKAGKLRAIGVGAPKRLAIFPDLPTFAEAGVANVENGSFYGLAAPAGTPKAIVDKLQADLAKIIHSPESVARLESVGAMPVANTPAQFVQYLKQEVEKWGKIVRENGIKAS